MLGASGMAGHVMAAHLEGQGHDVSRVAGRRKVTPGTVLADLTDPTTLRAVQLRAFDVVVNCVGVLLPDVARDRARAAYLNSYLPHHLSRMLAGTATRLVHVSTDCVFSGDRGGYIESDRPDATHFYGRSKALGEVTAGKDLTVRLSLVGPEVDAGGSGLFGWLAREKGMVRGYRHAVWNGVTTLEFARAVEAALVQDLTGLYHLTPPEQISKADLIALIVDVFDLPVTVDAVDSDLNDKTLVDTRQDLGYRPSGYRAQVEEMRDWIRDHPGLYGHYL